mmetsp:Transcript_33736/g.74013  ORF Transcript_33736/g.74013 Transcript_33736/m.74013 type:complete len:214 (-) Transcript_33736:683-1324(-)
MHVCISSRSSSAAVIHVSLEVVLTVESSIRAAIFPTGSHDDDASDMLGAIEVPAAVCMDDMPSAAVWRVVELAIEDDVISSAISLIMAPAACQEPESLSLSSSSSSSASPSDAARAGGGVMVRLEPPPRGRGTCFRVGQNSNCTSFSFVLTGVALASTSFNALLLLVPAEAALAPSCFLLGLDDDLETRRMTSSRYPIALATASASCSLVCCC